MHISLFHVATGGFDWMTDIDETAGKDERSTETTNLPTVIMDSSARDESDQWFVKISSIIYFPELSLDYLTNWSLQIEQ